MILPEEWVFHLMSFHTSMNTNLPAIFQSNLCYSPTVILRLPTALRQFQTVLSRVLGWFNLQGMYYALKRFRLIYHLRVADIWKHVGQTPKSLTLFILRLFQQIAWSWNLRIMSKIHIHHTIYQSTWIASPHHHISQQYGKMGGKATWSVILSMTS